MSTNKIFITVILCLLLTVGASIIGYNVNKYYYNPNQNLFNISPNKTEKLVKIIKTIQPKIDQGVCGLIAKSVIKYSSEYQLPPELIICIIKQESTFRLTLTSTPTPKSKAGCMGLMQINPLAHPEKLKKLKIQKFSELYHIDKNIHLGCMILREYYDKSKDIQKALNRYVGGDQKYVNDILSQFATIVIQDKKEIEVKKEIKEETENRNPKEKE